MLGLRGSILNIIDFQVSQTRLQSVGQLTAQQIHGLASAVTELQKADLQQQQLVQQTWIAVEKGSTKVPTGPQEQLALASACPSTHLVALIALKQGWIALDGCQWPSIA